jgi:hypothetical protein
VWLGHIGMDRLLSFGLKYPDRFRHTHLSSPHGNHDSSVSRAVELGGR